MPRWVRLLLLTVGVLFMVAGALVGVFGTRQAQAHLAQVERLSPLSATALDNQPVGASVLVEGVVSPRNKIVFHTFVAYVREKLEVTTNSDGDRSERWSFDGRETPSLAIEAGGVVMVGNASYSIEQGHEIWYDNATLGFNDRPRNGSTRYEGLVVDRTVTVFGNVVEGPEGKELDAQTIFGGTHAQYLAAQRESTIFMPIFGAGFGAAGLLLSALGTLLFRRR